MRFFSFKSKASRNPRNHPARLPLPENGVFWMVLFLLTIGSISSLYEKSLNKSASSDATSAYNYSYEVRNKSLPIYCVKTDQPRVALSFDAAWGNEDTRQIMDILEKHNIKVTFFMTGGWVKKYPDDVKYIASQGHELGNHSASHKNMSTLSSSEIKEEITTVHDQVKALTGLSMNLFRPPYGDYDDKVIWSVDSLGYYPIQWDVDSLDWKDYGTASIIDEVVNNKHLSNGSIILMHNGAKYTPAALEAVISGLQAKGFEIVPVSQLIMKNNFHMDQEGRQIPEE